MKRIVLILFVCLSVGIYCEAQTKISEKTKFKVDSLLKELTVEEKVSLLHGFGSGTGEFGDKEANVFGVSGVQRLGIPDVYMGHGLTGVRVGRDTSVYSTYMCSPIAMGCSWDLDLYYKIGDAIAHEMRALGQDLNLGPTINIIRHPLGGRNWESLSEDPYLTSRFIVEYVKAMQNAGVICGPKHFAANNQETNRFDINNVIDERTLREIYLPAFEAAVKEGGALNLMASYNRLNGVFMCQNRRMLTDILRDEWGFEGFVLSDFGNGVRSTLAAANAGLNIEMHGARFYGKPMLDCVKNGSLGEFTIDSLLKDYLSVIYEMEIDSRPRYENYPVHSSEHISLAREAARNSIVLLKNDGILPLRRNNKIAVIGPNAKQFSVKEGCNERAYYLQGGGSGRTYYFPNSIVSPYDGIINHTKKEVSYALGCLTPDLYSRNKQAEAENPTELSLIEEAARTAGNAEIAVLSVGLSGYNESEAWDRNTGRLPGYQEELINRICEVQKNVVVVVTSGSYVDMSRWEDKVSAIIFAPYCGEQIGNAIADVIFGKTNPSGHLSFTWPESVSDYPEGSIFRGQGFSKTGKSNRYAEGVFVGYRWFDTEKIPVKYPFGYGLSYTDFDYSNMAVSQTGKYEFVISFTVKNIGKEKGKDVAQLYVSEMSPCINRPAKELKGFAKFELKPGESKRISLSLDFRSFAYYDVDNKKWTVNPGKYILSIQKDCSDKGVECTIELK